MEKSGDLCLSATSFFQGPGGSRAGSFPNPEPEAKNVFGVHDHLCKADSAGLDWAGFAGGRGAATNINERQIAKSLIEPNAGLEKVLLIVVMPKGLPR